MSKEGGFWDFFGKNELMRSAMDCEARTDSRGYL